MPGLFGGGGKTQTVQQSADPWEGVQTPLKGGYTTLTNIFRPGGSKPWVDAPDYYRGSTVAPMSGYTQSAINAQAGRAAGGSPLVDAAQSGMRRIVGGGNWNQVGPQFGDMQRLDRDVLQGDYLKAGNPYLQGAINAATRPMIQNYENTIAPGLDSAFSSAGRYGSGAHANAQGMAAEGLTRGIGDVSSNMAFQNYGMERGLQEAAAGRAGNLYTDFIDNQLAAGALAPGLANQDYFDINQLGAAGSALDAYRQSQINADIDRWNYNQDADWNRTKDFISTLAGGTQWGGTTTSQGATPNAFTSALGGASTGAGLASLLGAGAGSTGMFAGAGIGSLLGLLSDARAKENIRVVGKLNNGLPVYVFNYIGDPVTQIGLMAQDVEKVRPEAVTEFDGLKRVRYDLAVEAV